MQKVLIISYFFPPCNLTASQRAHSWAKHLNEFGFYPIIVTRKWEKHVRSYVDCHYATSDGDLVEKHDNYEVHFCPYKPNLRDRLHTGNKVFLLKKFLSLIELILHNISSKFCVFNSVYLKADELLRESKEISAVVISGNPFIQFKFGYDLNAKHGTPWIADYRDAWTTSTIANTVNNPIKKLLNFYNQYFEKKWVSSASFVTASSDPIGESVSKLVNVSQKAIYNGYDPEDFESIKSINSTTQHFQIAYIGTLYDGQKIEIFVDAFKKFIEQLNPNCKLLFPGLEIDKIQHLRITELLHGYRKYYTTTGRIERKEILNIEKESHILLHIAWSGYDGIVASKIYEYIGAKRKILVVPGDNSTIDKIVKESKAGVILNNVQDTFEFLCNGYKQFLSNTYILPYQSEDSSQQFTREYQTKELSSLLKKITS